MKRNMSPIGNRQSAIGNSSYHLSGIGGAGMSALAQVLLAQGCRVSGSDRQLDAGKPTDVLEKLRAGGVTLTPQDGSGVTGGLSGLVVSAAIEADNPEIVAARQRRIHILQRAECLAQLANARTCIAVAGTAGKTTVTGMIGWTLEKLGADPTVVNGGVLLDWISPDRIGNVRIGRSNVWVVEVDESDRSLLRFRPDWAVITNVSKDHFEFEELQHLFKAFAGQVKRAVVGCYGLATDDEARPEAEPCGLGTLQGSHVACPDRPAHRDSASWRAGLQPELKLSGIHFAYGGVDFNLPLLGRHNAENALQTILLCERMGKALPEISRALSRFGGIQRRLERVGQRRGITVIDDYAHNPAKIAAAWNAVAPFFPRVLAVWRPHGFGPLALMLSELVQNFGALARPADRVFILPVYFAGGTTQRTVTSETLVTALGPRGVRAELAESYEDLLSRLKAEAKAGDVVLWMGARDPDLGIYARRFLAELR